MDVHIQHDTSLLQMQFSSLDFGKRHRHRTLKMAQFPWNGLWITALEAKTSEDVDRLAESTKNQAGWHRDRNFMINIWLSFICKVDQGEVIRQSVQPHADACVSIHPHPKRIGTCYW